MTQKDYFSKSLRVFFGGGLFVLEISFTVCQDKPAAAHRFIWVFSSDKLGCILANSGVSWIELFVLDWTEIFFVMACRKLFYFT